jgi:cation diffusion facilitator CzcD-associated flavoprotein CzcO
MTDSATPEHVDVLIVGAGLSGVGAACQLRTRLPGKSLAILESRGASGGTWDLFRYPGIRSDSDMFTFSYRWRPWPSDTALADGPLILDYVRTVAREYAVDELIRYHHRVTAASWDSETARWSVTIDRDGETITMTAGFLWSCAGYYDYEEGYEPELPGAETFQGQLFHPQHWPDDLEYAGKRVVVIGSGATAITLAPAMADEAEHVTMLQRSPSYVLTVPETDPVSHGLQRLGVPASAIYKMGRWRNIALQRALYDASRAQPGMVRKALLGLVRSQLRGKVDLRHFSPRYKPWDERLCVVPDGDLFRVLREGSASVVTDHIETFTEDGVTIERQQVQLPAALKTLGVHQVRMIAEARPVQQPGDHIELGPVAVRRAEDGEAPAYRVRQVRHGETVAVERRGVGACRPRPPHLPVENAERSGQQVPPVQIRVDRLPAFDVHIDIGAECLAKAAADFRLVDADAPGGRGPEAAKGVTQGLPPIGVRGGAGAGDRARTGHVHTLHADHGAALAHRHADDLRHRAAVRGLRRVRGPPRLPDRRRRGQVPGTGRPGGPAAVGGRIPAVPDQQVRHRHGAAEPGPAGQQVEPDAAAALRMAAALAGTGGSAGPEHVAELSGAAHPVLST